MDHDKSMVSRSRGAILVVLICFFLSGLTGLVYEILWMRMIVKLIGGAPFAVSIVLTVFMGGLGVGSLIAGRIVDRVKNPLSLIGIYGVLELAIGAYALIIPVLLRVSKPLYAFVYNQLFDHFMVYSLLTFVGCAILLCIPVICMGATLPILCRFYVTRLSHLGTNAGRLYGLNTIGAALGALVCGFWLVSILGVMGTLICAVTMNVAIGIVCIGLSVVLKGPRSDVCLDDETMLQSEAQQKADLNDGFRHRDVVVSALLIFFVSGFCSMAYEVIWTKLLGLIVGPTNYSFTILLATFITGLAFGSILFGWLGDRSGRPFLLLILTQILAGFFVLAVSQILGNSQFFFAKLIYTFKGHFGLLHIVKAGVLFCIMIIPTLCLGATFPLVSKIYTQSGSRIGRSIGFAYAVNTIGAVLGSFCAGFVLVPVVGKENSLSLVIGLQLLTTMVVASVILVRKGQRSFKLAWPMVPCLIGMVMCVYFPMWNRQSLSIGKYHRLDIMKSAIENTSWLKSILFGPQKLKTVDRFDLLYYGDGIGGFTSVIEFRNSLGRVERMLANAGKVDASVRGDMKTQTLSAHFPMLFHPGAKKVMVLGLASGVTAGEVLNYPIDQLDVLEISEQVVEASEFFIPWNNEVLSNPKTNMIIQDGRAHLELTKEKYDVIISEPSNPWMAGLATLFTKEFFSLARDGLNDDGSFLQFLHSYEMDWSTFSLVGRTFARVFPNSLIISTSVGTYRDCLLIGIKGASKLAMKNVHRNLPYAQQSTNVKILDPTLIYRFIVSEDLEMLFGEGPINTDSHPRLEFSAPKLMFYKTSADCGPMIAENINKRKWVGATTQRFIEKVDTDVDMQIDFAAYAFSVYSPLEDMVDLSSMNEVQKKRFFKMAEDYCAQNTIKYSILKGEDLIERCKDIHLASAKKEIEAHPDNVSAYFHVAKQYYLRKMLDESVSVYLALLRIEPDNPSVHNNIGISLTGLGRDDEAVKHFREALRLKSDFASAQSNLGYISVRRGDFKEAVVQLTKALALKYDSAVTHYDLALALVQLGQAEESIGHFKETIRLKPEWVGPRSSFAWLLATHNDARIRNGAEAIRLAKQACELTGYAESRLLVTLAVGYAASGEFSEAIDTLGRALNLTQATNDRKLTDDIDKYLNLFKAQKPYISP